jgi:hypothetical protein
MAHIFHLLTRQFTILTILTFKIKLFFWNIEDLLLFISFFIVFHILIFFTFAHVKNVFNATFNNISVKLWLSVLLVEETRVPGENH